MRTRTIYHAQIDAAVACERDVLSHRDGKPYQYTERRKRKERQWTVFERELLRRMDERDTMRGELAEARAFISTIIDAPKDYPAEEGM